ncbi:omega-hydroxypalmitate O-feruloyl transferase-like [Macadamia integrifolia]|uniref:omega-hydroxypalmitate O-feruloyl transferase-like n=1 Tax=Macadamia integrifolia TaxID=60698 RepID=UPI001C4E590B|nr:omega-hydroxypalmitate O-feruloyl transferase-like [Macadamia integrifolia]XP_042512827.1 omega-hydroxypalmitate O-feruloyl transferase-like [Macadamia integrifolia]
MATSHGSGEAELRITKSKPVVVPPPMKTYDGLYYLSPIDEILMGPLDILFCFETDDEKRTENLCETIKQALAKVLVHFYPFAGSLVMGPDGNFMVKCTGEGVSFVEAVANCELRELGDFTILDLPKQRQLVHAWNESENPSEIPLLVVQVTRFQCGGFVIGLAVNHCMCDGASLLEFMKSWGEIARGLPVSVVPFLDRCILKPNQPLETDEYNHDNISAMSEDGSNVSSYLVRRDEQSIFKSFSFDLQKLKQLKKIAAMEDDGTIKGTTATDFELIMAFIWRARTKALKLNPSETSMLLIIVDGRHHRFGPSIPEGYFGNAILITGCECSAGELIENPLCFAVDLIKRGLELEFIQSLDNYVNYIQFVKVTVEAARTELLLDRAFVGNKWSRFLSNDIDFGWGGPTQIANACPQKEIVVVHAQRKGSKNKILTLGLCPSDMKAFEEMMQSEMGIQTCT